MFLTDSHSGKKLIQCLPCERIRQYEHSIMPIHRKLMTKWKAHIWHGKFCKQKQRQDNDNELETFTWSHASLKIGINWSTIILKCVHE